MPETEKKPGFFGRLKNEFREAKENKEKEKKYYGERYKKSYNRARYKYLGKKASRDARHDAQSGHGSVLGTIGRAGHKIAQEGNDFFYGFRTSVDDDRLKDDLPGLPPWEKKRRR